MAMRCLKMMQKKYGVNLGSSSIYPELGRLEKRGLVASSWVFSFEKAQKKYRITQKGQTLVEGIFCGVKSSYSSFGFT